MKLARRSLFGGVTGLLLGRFVGDEKQQQLEIITASVRRGLASFKVSSFDEGERVFHVTVAIQTVIDFIVIEIKQ